MINSDGDAIAGASQPRNQWELFYNPRASENGSDDYLLLWLRLIKEEEIDTNGVYLLYVGAPLALMKLRKESYLGDYFLFEFLLMRAVSCTITEVTNNAYDLSIPEAK